MKKIFTLAAVACIALAGQAQSIKVQSVDYQLAADHASGCEIDLNNDGILEAIIGGDNAVGQTVLDANGDEVTKENNAMWLLKWDGSKYAASQFSQYGVQWDRRHVIPADFNGDGYVDLYLASGGDAHTLNGIYLNDKNGGFVKDDSFKVLDEDGNAIEDPETGELRWLPRAADVADFNNDGLLDIVTCGWWLAPQTQTAMAGVLINNGDGTYTVTNRYLMGSEFDETSVAFALCTIKAYDLNNDGYADFMVQGNVDNVDEVGTRFGRTFMMFRNMGEDGPGEFYSLEAESNSFSHSYGNGNFNVADFNNDGAPDFFVTGECPGDGKNGWEYDGQLFNGKISKGNVSFTRDQSFVAAGADIRPLNSTNLGTRAIDYNGDGHYDLFLDGWSEKMLDGTPNTQCGFLLKGSANGLTSFERIPGASEQGILFLDYGVEGDRNYCFTGYHGDDNFYAEEAGMGRCMVYTKNPWATPARPDAPVNLQATVNKNEVTLTWDAPASAQNNVTYELYLKKDGKIYNGCTSFIGGANDGVRKVVREGNVYMARTITLNLADGVYEWGVQTVNASLRGSQFTNGQAIVVGTSGVSHVSTAADAEQYFTVDGKQIAAPQQGITIVKKAGTVTKIVK